MGATTRRLRMTVTVRIAAMAVVLLAATAGCKKEVHVGVQCETVEDGAKCTVTHQSG